MTRIRIISIAAAALTLAAAPAASAAERLTASEARAAVEATNANPSSETRLAKALAFTRSDIGTATTILQDAERTGTRRIRFTAEVVITRFADGTQPDSFADPFTKRVHLTIVKRASGRVIARSTVVLPSGEAFTVGRSIRLG